jgi:hypothetical protein
MVCYQQTLSCGALSNATCNMGTSGSAVSTDRYRAHSGSWVMYANAHPISITPIHIIITPTSLWDTMAYSVRCEANSDNDLSPDVMNNSGVSLFVVITDLPRITPVTPFVLPREMWMSVLSMIRWIDIIHPG